GHIGIFSQLFGREQEGETVSEVAKEEPSQEKEAEAEKVAEDKDTKEEKAEKKKTKAEKEEREEEAVLKAKKVKSSLPVSEIASQGFWASDGAGGWMFMTQDGTVPYSGWLTDVDGKTYYLGDDYLMITGWLEEDGKTYYFDLDGIMQVGEVEVDGEVYSFGSDGILIMADQKKETASREEKKETIAERKSKGAIALTFDDGPSDFTPDLLAALAEYGAHATFFMVGKEVEARPEIPGQMVSLGMELGNHTYDHVDLTKATAEEAREAVGKVDSLLMELAGSPSTVIRPPYGNVNDQVKALFSSPLILWSVDTMDWDTLNVKKTVKAVKEGARDGAIILMHDYYETTVKAAIEVIPWLIEEGYELLTVHELAERKGVTLLPGEVYSDFAAG
ncbi:MAG: polysaccharide deacetylase family protein, partial [Blautia sp.]|nr:polysaccharide deacetylase family protein [Blautia sp.]